MKNFLIKIIVKAHMFLLKAVTYSSMYMVDVVIRVDKWLNAK